MTLTYSPLEWLQRFLSSLTLTFQAFSPGDAGLNDFQHAHLVHPDETNLYVFFLKLFKNQPFGMISMPQEKVDLIFF